MRFLIPFLFCVACGKEETDADGDGWPEGDDCDDHNNIVHPEGIEQCDDLDNDCDNQVDEGLNLAFWVDADGDGFGGQTSDLACRLEDGLVEVAGDCDDSNADVHPDAEELCNGIDDNCDNINPQAVTWYADTDGDGFGDPKSSKSTCADDPGGFVLDNTDCDDGNELANPGEDEACTNDFDDDCDGYIADGTDPDGDGFLPEECPGGNDCNDDDGGIHPDAVDVCENGVDEDCTGADAYCGFDGEFDLALADAILTSEVKKSDAGRLIDVGDMNGDGLQDLLVAAVNINGGFFVAGPISGTSTFEAVGHTLSGVEAVGAGRSIGVGDVDGDGLDDVAFGAPDGDLTGQFVVYGPIGADVDLDSASDAQLLGEPGTFAGHGSDLADIDDDGIADSIVGAYAGAGSIYVEYGPLTANVDLLSEADATIDSTVDKDFVTGRVIHAGVDLDGDGIGDVVTSVLHAPKAKHVFSSGGLYVVSGPVSIATLDDAVFLAGPSTSFDAAGQAFALGDYDGDGTGDLAAWCPSFHASRGVYLMRGPLKADGSLDDADTILTSDSDEDFAGMGIGAGDFDLDGIDDLLVGSPGDDEASLEAGATYLVSNPPTGSSEVEDVAQAVFLGGTTGDMSGMATATAILDGADYAEIVMGAPGLAESGGISVVYAVF